MVFRDLFSVMLTYLGYCCRSGLLSCFALCGDPFQTACPFRPRCNKKGVHFQREPMLPLKMNAFAHFVFKKDLI